MGGADERRGSPGGKLFEESWELAMEYLRLLLLGLLLSRPRRVSTDGVLIIGREDELVVVLLRRGGEVGLARDDAITLVLLFLF
jgi:hypothetical protein